MFWGKRDVSQDSYFSRTNKVMYWLAVGFPSHRILWKLWGPQNIAALLLLESYGVWAKYNSKHFLPQIGVSSSPGQQWATTPSHNFSQDPKTGADVFSPRLDLDTFKLGQEEVDPYSFSLKSPPHTCLDLMTGYIDSMVTLPLVISSEIKHLFEAHLSPWLKFFPFFMGPCFVGL